MKTASKKNKNLHLKDYIWSEGGREGVLPYMGYIGMCCGIGYGVLVFEVLDP